MCMEKQVLLFSGGFDSMLQEWLIQPDVLLYVDMKTKYSQREIEHLATLPKTYQDRLVIKEVPLGEYERDNSYLPYRNLILGTIGMQYGQHVYFGFNLFDDAPDKDRKFIRQMNKMFKHLNKNCVWDMDWDNTNFGFYAPFQSKTKTQMVKMCLEAGMSVERIQNTRSCYSGESVIGCGKCRVCLHKAVALLNNGIYREDLFDAPLTEEDFTEAYEVAKERGLPKSYVHEVRQAHRVFKKS